MVIYEPRETVFHRSLVEVPMIAGVQKNLAIMNFVIGAVFVESLHIIWFPVVTFFIHLMLKWMTKNDPMVFDIYQKYKLEGDHYDPWPRSHQDQGQRPEGFGKGMLC